jgi:hypothetical protein
MSSPRTAGPWRSPTTGTRRTSAATSGTSARTRRSSRTAGPSRRPDRGRPASTAPRPGSSFPPSLAWACRYRQEHYAGEAEDAAEVLSLDEQAEVPFGHFTGALLTKDFTPLQPKILEYKLYATGVGPVLVLGVSGGSDREELVRFTK